MPRRASARTSRASMSAASRIVDDDRSRAGAACRGPSGAWHGPRPARPSPRPRRSQTPWARMMSPSNSSGPAASALPKLVCFGQREGEDVGRLVLAAPLGVERADFVVAGQPDRNLDRARTSVASCGECAFGDRGVRRRAATSVVPARCYCPIPRRLRWRPRASSARALHRPRRSGRRAGGGRRRRR